MRSAQILREKITSGQLTLGIIVTMHFWLELIEIARNAGLDYLIIDTEHTSWDDERVAQACAIGRMIDFPILIRPAETQARLVRMAARNACSCGSQRSLSSCHGLHSCSMRLGRASSNQSASWKGSPRPITPGISSFESRLSP